MHAPTSSSPPTVWWSECRNPTVSAVHSLALEFNVIPTGIVLRHQHHLFRVVILRASMHPEAESTDRGIRSFDWSQYFSLSEGKTSVLLGHTTDTLELQRDRQDDICSRYVCSRGCSSAPGCCHKNTTTSEERERDKDLKKGQQQV